MENQLAVPGDDCRYPTEASHSNTTTILHKAFIAVARFSAKLLFQFRVDVDGDPGKRRFCEERIVVLEANTAQVALNKSNRRGKRAEHSYANDDGNTVYFEFIGILELLQLGAECDDDEVWYAIRERMLPMERRDKLIPSESDLNAIRNAQENGG